MEIRRWLEAKRAPAKKDFTGHMYTPSGIDIYATDDPELVRLRQFGSEAVRIDDLLTILDELDRYERRSKLTGEKMEIQLRFVQPDKKEGDVYHRDGFMLARPSEDHRGLICLDIFSEMGLGCITLTADRKELREALDHHKALLKLEAEDKERLTKEVE